MLAYSLLFSRWAGWDVSPANFMLAGSHMFNIAAQANHNIVNPDPNPNLSHPSNLTLQHRQPYP